jgi:ATP-dependent helicase HrpA
VRGYATLGPPRPVLGGPRKHQRMMIERRLSYFGFELETVVEPVEGLFPPELADEAREVLATALAQGDTQHPDQSRLRRVLAYLDELWRRSGGKLQSISPEALRATLRAQLDRVSSWEEFLSRRLGLDAAELVDAATRERLESLPERLHVRGDAVPLEYEIQNGEGVARVRLREGQAKRLRPDELPRLDRPLRFAVQRGRHPPLLADTIPALHHLLRRSRRDADEATVHERPGGRRGGPRHRRNHRRPRHRRH